MRIAHFRKGRATSCGFFLLGTLPFIAMAILVGCASYSSLIQAPRAQFERGEYDGAVLRLRELAAQKDNDQLLYLMDLGMVLHTAGRYEEAIKAFLEADHIAEIKDYTNLSEEALSFLVSEDAKVYKGEHFEKLLINVYLAIDYTLLGKKEEALVECRKVNHKLDLMIRQGNLPYEHNSFAKYLAAVLFESEREYNDALVDYRAVQKWRDGYPYLPGPLLRLTDRLKMSQEFEEFKKRYPSETDYRINKNEGEIVLLLEQGRAPVKVPSEQFGIIPRFDRRYYSSDHVRLRVNDRTAETAPLYDIESVAIAELDHRLSLIAAKKIGGLVVKELIARKVEEEAKSPLLGFLLRLFFYSQEKADLRSWTTLPARLQLSRLVVPAGRHRISLDMVWRSGSDSKEMKVWENVEVKPGQKVFLNYRTPD